MTPREKAARAICNRLRVDPDELNQGDIEPAWKGYLHLADAALSAALEITDEDVEAARTAFWCGTPTTAQVGAQIDRQCMRQALHAFVARRK